MMELIIIHPRSKEDLQLFEQLANRLDAPFEMAEEQSPYDPDFVKKILQGDKDIKEGKGRKITIDELDKLWK